MQLWRYGREKCAFVGATVQRRPNVVTWGVQVLRSHNLFKKNYSQQEAEYAVISQRNHPVDIHIFHNVHATIAWPQQTLLYETLELERTT